MEITVRNFEHLLCHCIKCKEVKGATSLQSSAAVISFNGLNDQEFAERYDDDSDMDYEDDSTVNNTIYYNRSEKKNIYPALPGSFSFEKENKPSASSSMKSDIMNSDKMPASQSHKYNCVKHRNPTVFNCKCFPIFDEQNKPVLYLSEFEYDEMRNINQPATQSSSSSSGFNPSAPTYMPGPSNQDTFWKSPKSNIEQMLVKHTKKVGKDAVRDQKSCSVCLEDLSELSSYDVSQVDKARGLSGAVELNLCGHAFHIQCLKNLMSSNQGTLRCPNCSKIHGIRTGTQPKGGRMEIKYDKYTSLPGEKNSDGAIVITYHIPRGTQGPEHPHPGRPYNAFSFPRTAFVPNTPKGKKVAKLLKIAFDRRLIFTVGTSSTTGADDSVVWNDIHHKTNTHGPANHGYPDPNYLQNVLTELKNVGVDENCEEFVPEQPAPSKGGNFFDKLRMKKN